MKRGCVLLALAACGPDGGTQNHPDARPSPDGSTHPDTSSQQPYRHAVALDGLDDFAVAEQFTTTSTSFAARITWDDKNIYVGYSGPDLAPTTSDAAQKW